MTESFIPKLDILPPAQLRLWPELGEVSPDFVLYGGTAIALHLGHRGSEDFDFFSHRPFQVEELRKQIPFLKEGIIRQSSENTLTITLDRDGPVQISFFGGIRLGRVGRPVQSREPNVWIASLNDLSGMKTAVIQERVEAKDYLDIEALLRSGIKLTEALGFARALYGESFNPLITLKALCHFKGGDLHRLDEKSRAFLEREASRITDIPEVRRLNARLTV